MLKYLSVLLLAISLTACANNRETRAAMMGAAAGAIIGTMAAQQSEGGSHAAPAHTSGHDAMQTHDEHASSEAMKDEGDNADEGEHHESKKEGDDHEDEHDD